MTTEHNSIAARITAISADLHARGITIPIDILIRRLALLQGGAS